MAILAGAISLNRWAYSVDQAIYDAAIAQFRKPIDQDILIIAIDERSLLELGRWPWSRDLHAQLLDELADAGVEAVAFDVVFAEPDRVNPNNDHVFAQAIQAMGRVALLVHMEQTHAGGQILEVMPDPLLLQSAAAAGHVHIEYDVDGVSRAVFLKEGLGEAYWPHLMHALWGLVDPNVSDDFPGLRPKAAQTASPFVIQRDYYNLIPLADPTSTVATVSYTDVIHNRIAPRNLKGKIAIVGATAKGLGDIVATSIGPMSGVEFNANVLNALRNGSTILPVSKLAHALISVLAVFGIIMLGVRASPRDYLVLTVSAVAIWLTLSVVGLFTVRVWFAPLSVILPLLVFYPLWSWRRLEQALVFLRRELARVEQQTRPEQIWHVNEAQKKLAFLAGVTGVLQWQLVARESLPLKPSRLFLGADDNNGVGEPALISGGGAREQRTLAIVSEAGATEFELQWQWPDQVAEVDKGLWLNAINMIANQKVGVEKKIPSELVSETIAQLRQANKQIDESRAFFDRCLENLQDAVLVANLFGEVVFANARARVLFGLNQPVGAALMPCLEQLQIDQGWPAVIGRIVHDQGEIYAEVRGEQETEAFFLQLASLKWRSDDLDTLLFSFTDVSFIKEAERVRSEALQFLSHDLRSPVVSILALLEHYRSRNTEQLVSDAGLREVFTEIEQYARKNLSFAESFLHLARAEIVGDSKFDLCDMHSVVDNALMMTRQQALAKSIGVDVDRTLDDLWVWGDGELLERVVVNLLSNGIKYSEPNTKISLHMRGNSGAVELQVADQGIGISADELDTIFQRFHRAAGGLPVSGAGLGLHFVDTVCKKHGGSITVASELGVGSTFTVVLPLCDNQFDE